MSFIEAATIVSGPPSRIIKPPPSTPNSKFSLFVLSAPSYVWAYEQHSEGKTEQTHKIDLERDTNWKVIMHRNVEKQVCRLDLRVGRGSVGKSRRM